MEELVCNICHEDIREGNEVGEINSCTHRFCFECIAKWATIENSCPCCKVRFDVLRRKQASCTPGRLANLPPTAPIPGKILGEERCEEVNQRPIFEDPSFEQWIQNVICLVCGNADNEDRLLLCDDCDSACHTYCVGLDSIPEGEWFCSSCTARRSQAQRGQQRRAQQQLQDEERSRRRRQRTLIISDDEEEEDDVQIVEERPGRRDSISNRRNRGNAMAAAARAASARGGASTRDGDDLEGFIVSDSEDQGSSDYGEEEELGLEERFRRRRRLQNGTGSTGARNSKRDRGGGGGALRQRHQRAIENALDSDFEEEVDWDEYKFSEDEEEDDFDLDSPAVVARTTTAAAAAAGRGGAGAVGDGWRQAKRGSNTDRNASKDTNRPSRKRKKNRTIDEDDDLNLDIEFSPAEIARDAVEKLTNNWDEIRKGTTSFNQVLGNSNNNNNRRSRQGREAARVSRAAAAQKADVVDLSISPAAAAAVGTGVINNTRWQQQQQQSTRPGLSPPLGITSLSSRLRAELNACREKGARLPSRKINNNINNTNGASTSAAAAANRNTANNTLDVQSYFAAADEAATLDTNEKKKKKKTKKNSSSTKQGTLPSSSPFLSSSPFISWRATHNARSPGSGGPHRMRTVHDVHRGAEVARRTPTAIGGNGTNTNLNGLMRPPPPPTLNQLPNYRSSPAPLQQRLAARAAAEWGGTNTHGASGSGNGNGTLIRNDLNAPAASPQWRQAKRHQNDQQQQQQAARKDRRSLFDLPKVLRYYSRQSPPPSVDAPPKQRQQPEHQQQQQQLPQMSERRDVPLFLRNAGANTISTNPEQQQAIQLQSPSYSPSSVPRNNNNNARNNGTTGATPPSVAKAKKKKQQAYDAVRAHAKLYYTEDAISREQYKKVARIATHKLYEKHGGGPPDEFPSSQEAAEVVDEVLIAVIQGKI